MAVQTHLSDFEQFLLTTPDDTEDAPWMVMPDFQWRILALLKSLLQAYARRAGQSWYVATDLKVTADHSGSARIPDVAPDLMVAAGDQVERRSWNVRLEGAPPLFVLEVVTEESFRRDTREKPAIYERPGVRDYAIYAPLPEHGGPRLVGYHRDASGNWVAWEPDPTGALTSQALSGITLYVDGADELRARDRDGRRLTTDTEDLEAEVARLRAQLAERER